MRKARLTKAHSRSLRHYKKTLYALVENMAKELEEIEENKNEFKEGDIVSVETKGGVRYGEIIMENGKKSEIFR